MTLLVGEQRIPRARGPAGTSDRPTPRSLRRRFSIVLTVSAAVLAVWAPPAGAKGLKWVEVCGPLECARTEAEDLDLERHPLVFPPWVMSGRPDPPPEEAARWLHVRVRAGGKRMRSVVLPRAGYAGGDQGGGHGYVWQRLDRDERRTYRMLGRGVERFPASFLPGLAPDRRDPSETVGGAGTAHSIALGAQPPAFLV
jgi:hypothetical protein